MKVFERVVDTADRFQRRRPPLAFPIAVWKRFSDDRGGYLAALIAYFGFASFFPLLLVLVTVLSMVLKNDTALQHRLVDSALAQFPVIGTEIQNEELGSIPGTGLSLFVGIMFLLLGARALAGAIQEAMCSVWGVARSDRPGFLRSQLQGMALVFLIGIGFAATSTLSGVAAGSGNVLTGAYAQVATVIISLVLNVGVFWLGFRLATAGQVPWPQLRTGAIIAAVAWQVLETLGGYAVQHILQRSNQLYGTFGLILGLLVWLYVQAQVTLYAAEVDVVLAKELWPRSLGSGGQEPVPSDKDKGSRV